MMMKMKKSTNRKFLTTAVMCSLLAMGSSSAWAAQQTTETVNYGTNVSTAANPYSKIEVKTNRDQNRIALVLPLRAWNRLEILVYLGNDHFLDVFFAKGFNDGMGCENRYARTHQFIFVHLISAAFGSGFH